MKKLLIIIAVLFGFIGAKAQNPFAEYGYTPKIATLSQGQFNEFFDNDTIVQIGSVLYNTKSREIVAFVDSEDLCQVETIQPDVVSRWISPDPKAHWYYSMSPYNYVANNPIILVDPNGQWIESAWDAASLGLGVKSFINNVSKGNVGAAIVDGVGVLADGVALAVPLVPGGAGAIIKVVRGGDKVIDMAKGADNINDARKATNKGADFVVTPDGTAVPTSQSRMREGFDNAGFPKKEATKTSEKGQIHTVPTKSGKDVDVRTMEGGSGGDKRAVFNTPGKNSPRTPDGKTPTGTKEQIRKDSHLKQKD